MRKRMASSIRKDRSLPKPNQNEPNVEPKLGIARDTPHLARQFRGGWLLWLPDFLKRWIIGGWNHVSCALFGQRPPGTGCCRWVHAICTGCCRVVRNSIRTPIRTWDAAEAWKQRYRI